MSTQNKYLESKYVKVFPSGFRSLGFTESKLTTESNLLALRICSYNSENNHQVFTHPIDNNLLVIVLNGYYFEIEKSRIPVSDVAEMPLYAYIVTRDAGANIKKVLANASNSTVTALDEQVENLTLFKGLAFTNSVPSVNAGSVLIRDAQGNIVEQRLKYDASEIRAAKGVDVPITEAFGTNHLVASRLTGKGLDNLLVLDNKFKIQDISDVGKIYNVEINGALAIKKALTVNVDTTLGAAANQTGAITIKSAGSGATTIVGPSSGTITLPNNSTTDNALFNQNSSGLPGWITYSKSSTRDTIVQRDGTDIKSGSFNGVNLTKDNNGYIQLTSSVAALKISGKAEVTADGALVVGVVGNGDNTEKISISNTFKSNSDVNITKNVNIHSVFTLGENGKGAVTIKSSGADATTILGPNNGTISLPSSAAIPIASGQSNSGDHVWIQSRSSANVYTNSWVKVSSVAGTPNALVMTDSDGNINAEVSGVSDSSTKVQQSLDSTNAQYPILLSSGTTDGIRKPVFASSINANPATGALNAGSFNSLTLLAQSSGFKISGGTTSNKNLQVNDNVQINTALTIGESGKGAVTIKSNGNNATTIIGPNNGTVNLPANSTSDKVLLQQETKGTSSWISYDTSASNGSIVQRTSSGDIYTKKLFVDATSSASTSLTKAANINDSGQLTRVDLTTDSPVASTGDNPPFIKSVSQAASGKISATIERIPNASTSAGGVIKVHGVKTTKVTVNSSTSTSGRYYPIELNTDGKAFVNVPWTDTTYSGEKGISLSGSKFGHTNAITAGTAEGSAGTLGFSGSFTIPKITYDAYGHITGVTTTTVTLPANVDTKNTAGATNTSSKLFLIGATSQGANPQTYSHDTAYVGTDGCLYSGGSKVLTSYTDTKNTAGSSNTSSKIYLIGATSQGANPQTYSHDTAYVGTDGCLYSNGTKVSVEGHTHPITLAADTGTSSVTLSHGSKYKLTAGGQSIIFTMPTDTKAASGDTSSKIFLIGATSQASTGQTTYSHDTTYVDANACLHSKSFAASSDARLKTNIKKYKCEKSILDLPVYNFDFIDGPKNNIGCLAQDLQKICPEIVHEDAETGYLSIEESKLVYLLLQEIKELKAEVKALKGE